MDLFSREQTHCRFCGVKLPEPFLRLGNQPLANNLCETPYDTVPLASLSLIHCAECGLVQLDTVVDPKVLFGHYLYTPAANTQLVAHFQHAAEELIERYEMQPGDLVIDIGSNDGTLLRFFKQRGMRVIGIEPARNLAIPTAQSGIPTFNEYFGPTVVRHILADYGQAKLILATNSFAHINNIHAVVQGVSQLLQANGLFVVEAPGLLEDIERGNPDHIYHEHLSFLSVQPMKYLMAKHSMSLIDVQEIPSHGGSLRFISQHTGGPYSMTSSITERSLREDPLRDTATFIDFNERVMQIRYDLVEAVRSAGVVAGYGAPAKATVLITFCNFTARDIAYIVDDSPLKQGMYIPGTDIRIVSRDQATPVDTMVVFPWDVKDAILPKLVGLCKQAIIPIPRIEVVPVEEAQEGRQESQERVRQPGRHRRATQ